MKTVSLHGALIYYVGDMLWLSLILASAVFLVLRQRPAGRIKIILWTFFAAVILYNPISLRIITRVVEPMTYYRFFWIIPGGLLIATALLSLIHMVSNEVLSLLIAGAFFAFIFQTAVSFVQLDSFEIPANAYELGNDIFMLSEEITENKNKKMPVVAMPSPVQMEYRTYDASVRTAIRKETYQTMVGKSYMYSGKNRVRKAEFDIGALLDGNRLMDVDEAKEAFELLGADFVISPRNGDIYEVVTGAGYMEVATTDSYVLYSAGK